MDHGGNNAQHCFTSHQRMCVKNKFYFIELWWGHNHWQPKLVVYACLCDRFVEVDLNIVELAVSGK
jgi:hypothetical protein